MKKPIQTDKTKKPEADISRRDILRAGIGTTAAAALPHSADAQDLPDHGTAVPSSEKLSFPVARKDQSDRPYNVVLLISDEEAYRLRAAEGYFTPARDELKRRGTSFENHYIGAAMCTPSRGVMFTGQPPQINGVYDQMETGYVPSMRTDKPSLGTIFKSLGYKTAYFGKFELRKDIITPSPDVNYTDALQEYGFDTFAPDGDKVGGPDQAYDTDTYTGGAAIRWLRTNAQDLNDAGEPWLLVVSFVSPHDIMYADANQPGSKQQQSEVGMRLTPPPNNSHFATQWSFPASPSQFQPMDSPGRPRAHLSYMIGWSAFLGEIPVHATDMWNTYYNYYLNLIQDNDRNLGSVLEVLTALGLWENTVVMRTADHGELGGSHGGLRGKGPLPYEQECHVPAVIVHPEHPGGQTCQALTSHIDLIPSLVGLSNVDEAKKEAATRDLPGRDMSTLLRDPEKAATSELRDGVLFNYVGLQTIDANYMTRVCREIAHGRFAPPFEEARPDTSRRGFVNFVFDGRYKFARYFAPDNFNTPTTLDDLLANNEIELFDLQVDPDEVNNLGVDAREHEALVMKMNDLLNKMIENEVGTNDGSFLPAILRQ